MNKLIRDIPDDAAAILKQQAKASGLTFEAYLRFKLIELAKELKQMNTAETKQMTWNNDKQRYYYEYEDGRVLWVDGDAFIEAVHDAKKHDSEEAYDAAREELLDPELWENNALEVPAGQVLEDIPHFYQHDAWIMLK